MLNIDWLNKMFYRRKKQVSSVFSDFWKFFDHFPNTVEAYDLKGDMVYSNRKYPGHTNSNVQNSPNNIFNYPGIRDSDVYHCIQRAFTGETNVIQSKESYTEHFPWYLKHTIYEITIYPVVNIKSEVNNIVFVHREIQQNKPTFELYKEELSDLEKNITHSILANISHELRTPLNWIIGFSELINAENNIEKIKEFNRIIKSGGDLLLSQVEKLIEMSSIVKNSIIIEKSRFQVNQVLLELCGLIKSELDSLNKDINIEVKCELTGINAELTTDRIKLSQILLNLLDNSVKFTKEGAIELGVFLTLEKEYLFYVKDTGIGMDKSRQKYIFDIFRKGEDDDFTGQQGLGLGLSISSYYVKNLGGEIWVDSESGIGSTFCFTIKDLSEEVKNQEVLKLI
jgi:signal transduction histidine kinase